MRFALSVPPFTDPATVLALARHLPLDQLLLNID